MEFKDNAHKAGAALNYIMSANEQQGSDLAKRVVDVLHAEFNRADAYNHVNASTMTIGLLDGVARVIGAWTGAVIENDMPDASDDELEELRADVVAGCSAIFEQVLDHVLGEINKHVDNRRALATAAELTGSVPS